MSRPKSADETWVRTPVPTPIHRDLKIQAAKRGITMADLVREILTTAVVQPTEAR